MAKTTRNTNTAFFAWLTIDCITQQALAADTWTEKVKDAASIVQRTQADGHVRIIIEHQLPAAAFASSRSAKSSPQALEVLQDQVKSVQDELIAKHFGKAGMSSAQGASTTGAGFERNIRQMPISPMVALNATEDEIKSLAEDPEVKAVYIDHLHSPNLTQSVPLIGMTGNTGAYATGATGTGQMVVILDTGVQSNHPFLMQDASTSKVIVEECFSSPDPTINAVSLCPNGTIRQTGVGAASPLIAACNNGPLCDHGTHVAGIAAGNPINNNNSPPPSGVAKNALVGAAQIFTRFNRTIDCNPSPTPCVKSYVSDQVAALNWFYVMNGLGAVPGNLPIAAINMSLGDSSSNTGFCNNDPSKGIIDSLRDAGIATVISAGNDSYRGAVGAPGCIPTAITVASSDKADVISSFSNISSLVDVFAPGSNITSSVTTANANPYGIKSGTSMAAPHVTGAFAAMRSKYPNATVAQIEDALERTGLSITDNRTGGSVTKPRIRVDQAIAGIKFTLTVNMPIPGGRVTSFNANTIDCDYASHNVCNNSFTVGQRVTLYAEPAAGYTFTGWYYQICEERSNTGRYCTFTVRSNSEVTAMFGPLYNISIFKTGRGNINSNPSGLNCPDGSCTDITAAFPLFTDISVTATPATGYRFAAWDGACSGSALTCVIRADANKFASASFLALPQYTVNAWRQGGGTVTDQSGRIVCGDQCSADFYEGTTITLRATPNSSAYVFSGWSGGTCSGTSPVCTWTLGRNANVVANFAVKPQYQLTVNVTGTGRVTSTPAGIDCGNGYIKCQAWFYEGQTVDLVAGWPADGSWLFTQWQGDCIGSLGCSVVMKANKTVGAIFTEQKRLTVTKTGNGSLASIPAGIDCGISCSASFNKNTLVTLVATPQTGNTFTGWSGLWCTGRESCLVTMSDPKSVNATFQNTYTLIMPAINLLLLGD